MRTLRPKTMSPIWIDDSGKYQRHVFIVRGTTIVEFLKFRDKVEAQKAQREYRKRGFRQTLR